MDDATPRLTGRQLRDLIGLALMVVGALLTCGAAFLAHPAAGLALTGCWLVGGGWLLATTSGSEPDVDRVADREGGR